MATENPGRVPPSGNAATLVAPHPERLILAITRVPGSTKACAVRGDAEMFAALAEYYALVATATATAGGRVIKCMGDAVLLTFPANQVRAAVSALRNMQEAADALWRRFGAQCHVQLKVSNGVVMCGMLGAPGEERFDIIGGALNALIKAPWGDFDLSPEVVALLQAVRRRRKEDHS